MKHVLLIALMGLTYLTANAQQPLTTESLKGRWQFVQVEVDTAACREMDLNPAHFLEGFRAFFLGCRFAFEADGHFTGQYDADVLKRDLQKVNPDIWQGIQEDLFPLKGSRLQWRFHEPNQYLVIETAGGMGEIPPVFSAQLRQQNDKLLVVLEETPFILTAQRL